MSMNILTISCWSHSIQYCLFSWDGRTALVSGKVERVDLGGSTIIQNVPERKKYSKNVGFVDHKNAVALILDTLADPQHGVIADTEEISSVGHRIVHGGEKFRKSVVVSESILGEIRNLLDLAPLHIAANIAGIEAATELLPEIPHVAIFDTAFHLTMPDFAYIYPLPYEWYEKYNVRRYGFHGASHLYLSQRAAALLDKPLTACNLITVYIDKGVSLCAIKNGISIDTSMGMTPLEGAVMEKRCGDIDPGIPLYLMRMLNLSPREVEQILNQKSGISGITGRNMDRRQFLEAAYEGDARCKLALEIEAHRLKKYIGAYVAAVGPLDGIVFTVGAGKAEWFGRELTLTGLECFGICLDKEKNRANYSKKPKKGETVISTENSPVKIFIIPSDEEPIFAQEVAALLSEGATAQA